MSRIRPLPFSRRLLAASVFFGVFILFDLALFGWLIFRSLSQREVERILLETRTEAEGLARQIEERAKGQGDDLFTGIAVSRETRTYIDQILSHREIVQVVEVMDSDGNLVFRNQSEMTTPGLELQGAPVRPREIPPHTETVEQSFNIDFSVPPIEVPIGDLGVLVIGLSPGEMARRIELLRGELIHQATLIGAVTSALVVAAYLFIWYLLRRGRRLEEQAAEAERLAYVGTLASGLAHEIRNPLNSLNLNMQLLEEEIQRGGRVTSSRRLLSITRGEIGRLERLVNDFLNYARTRRLDLREVKPFELLEHVSQVLAGELGSRRVRVELEDRSEGAVVQVDPGQINQLLLNLVQNALLAMEDTDRSPVLRLAATRNGGRVALEVGDNGIGIPAESQGRIFELFYSTRRGGTGFGLAIAQRIARAHDGEILVDSRPGVGTRVSLLLPIGGQGGDGALRQ
jgi:signal transduction histidine kinase